MDLLAELKGGRDKAAVAYQEFALLAKRHHDSLFCFFEGNDNVYYVPRIMAFTVRYQLIRCGGRDKVLKVHGLIAGHKEYDHYKKAYFIDRDFNPPLEPKQPPIFETPCYAIENFYVSSTVFQEILKNFMGLSELSKTYQVCMALFSDRQREFHQAALLFNAWYACLIGHKNSTGEQIDVNLSDNLKGFICVDLGGVTATYTLASIKQDFAHAADIPQAVLAKKVTEFTACQAHQVFRGKYELWFLVTFIELLLLDSTKTQNFIKEKITFSFNNKLNNEQAIALFSPYAETPDTLTAYLQLVTP